VPAQAVPFQKGVSTMKSHWIAAASAMSFVLVWAGDAAGQSFLDTLETKLKEAAVDTVPAADPAPGYLGLVADETTDGRRSVEVLSVRDRGPAGEAGIRAGDLITAIDGRAVTSVDEMARALANRPAGNKVVFDVSRDRRSLRLTVTLGIAPSVTPLDSPDARPGVLPPPRTTTADDAAGGRVTLGVRATPVTDETRRRFGLTVRSGALVEEITAGSSADRYGIPLGAVIVALDGRRIDSPADLVDAVGRLRPLQEVEVTYFQADKQHRKTLRMPADAADEERSPLIAERVPPTSDPPMRLLPGGGDRPALRKLEGVIDRFVRPSGPIAEDNSMDVPALRRQVELLQNQVDQLQRRVSELESRIAEGSKK
jgi:predicted metalloprotease with PDZ domain